MDSHQADRIAQAWITAWNRHDLDAILAHYAPDVTFTSPFVSRLLGDPSGTIQGRDRLRVYFDRGLRAYPALRFELLRTLVGVDSMLLSYRSVNGLLAAEMMRLNADGLIQIVHVHYVEEAPP